MAARPLVIQDADFSVVRVLASPLELQNRKTVGDAYDYNVRLKEQKAAEAQQRIRDLAHDI